MSQQEPRAYSQSPAQVLDRLAEIWARAVEHGGEGSERITQLGLTIGTLTAAKVLWSLDLEAGFIPGDPKTLADFDELSKVLAEEHFSEVVGVLPGWSERSRRRWLSGLVRLRLAGEPGNLRWCGEWLRDDAPSVIDPEEIVAAQVPADRVLTEIMDSCATARDAVAWDEKQSDGQVFSELAALTTAAKLLLAMWEEEPVAARLEALADALAQVEVEQVREEDAP